MGRVIARVAGPERPKDVLIQDLALTLLTIPSPSPALCPRLGRGLFP